MLRYEYIITSDSGTTALNFPDLSKSYPLSANGIRDEEHIPQQLVSAIQQMIRERKHVPLPRRVILRESMYVALGVNATLKLQLHNTMVAQKLRKADLIRMLHTAPTTVDRALDLSFYTRTTFLERALKALGVEPHLYVDPIPKEEQ